MTEAIVVLVVTNLLPAPETGGSVATVESESLEPEEPVVVLLGYAVLFPPSSPGKTSPASHCCTSGVSKHDLYTMPFLCVVILLTYVLHDAASLPPEPVDHRPKAAGVVVEETLRVDVQGAKDVDVERPPDRAEDIQRGVGAVFRQRVVVLDFFFISVSRRFFV